MPCTPLWGGTAIYMCSIGMCRCEGYCFQAEDGIRDLVRSRGLGDVYKRQVFCGHQVLSSIQGTREVLLTGSYTHPLSTQVEKRCFRFCNSYPTET